MEYGEVFYTERTWISKGWVYSIPYRFRIDPVPFINNYRGWFRHWYKRPKTTQEKRYSYPHKEYVRGKRTFINLPNSWDDYHRSDRRTRHSWKKRYKCRKQWGKYV